VSWCMVRALLVVPASNVPTQTSKSRLVLPVVALQQR
jgi:hypothetical protein